MDLSRESLKEKKDYVLNETVAQDIFRELKQLRALADTHGKRWALELIQNALDASTEQGVDVKIRFTENSVIFYHNGRAFKEEELIHLIYHGSTKLDSESTSGKLGTGFLASHLLSMKVLVKGTLNNGSTFSFTLDREAANVKELTEKMKKTWSELESSLTTNGNEDNDTSYEYDINTDEQGKIYQTGITILKEAAPIILAFDKRLRSITISEDGKEYLWNRSESEKPNIVDISLTCNSEKVESTICSVIVINRDDTLLGLPLTLKTGKLSLIDITSLPKLYYPLPLIGTADFPFPALISNRAFTSTTDREVVLLTSKAEGDVRKNKKIVETSYEMFDEIIPIFHDGTFGAPHNLTRLPRLGKIQESCSRWLDIDWIKPLVVSLISKIRNTKILLTKDGMLLAKDSQIPILNSTRENLIALWKLVEKVYPKSTPREDDIEIWQEILSAWASYLNPSQPDPEHLDEAMTIEKLAGIVEEAGSLGGLKSKINIESVVDWLNELLKLILKIKKETLFEEKSILADQNENFHNKKGLFRDSSISEDLKDIAALLGRDVRAELLLNDLVADTVTNSRIEKEILLDVLERVKEQAKTDYQREEYQQANVKLLEWLVDNTKLEAIRESFPVFTRLRDIGEEEYVYPYSTEIRFLIPESNWNKEDRKHIDVFPPRAILSNLYAELGEERWRALAENNLVLQNLTFSQLLKLGDKQVKALSLDEIEEDDDLKHNSKTEVQVTSIPFLEEKDWGVVDGIRNSKTKAVKFLLFILDNLIKSDISWKSPTKIECSCDATHEIYPSLWLATLKNRQWVPVTGGGEEKPSSENLAPFFTQNELMKLLGNDQVSHFLGILGVNVSVIMTANKSNTDRIGIDRVVSRILAATNMDPKQLSEFAEAYSDENLRKKLLDAKAEKELVHANQKVGDLVEMLIRENIEKNLPKDAYKVEKVVRGSDIKISVPEDVEVSNDYLDSEGRELFLKIASTEKEHFVEVKSTREDSVRMTIPQAEQAHEVSDAYSLCVVKLNSDITEMSDEDAMKAVMESARFVFLIGDKLGNMLRNVNNLKKGEKELQNQGEQDMQIDIISETQIRIKINENVWINGLDFGSFVRRIGGNHSTRPRPCNL